MTALAAWIGARLAEPSTWAGLALIVNSVGSAVSTHDWTAIAQGVGGAIAVIAPEKHS
jgi:hypothetical protein